jgi:hypothetical protein
MITMKNGIKNSKEKYMNLNEAKQELIEHGYIIAEVTETADDELEYLSKQNTQKARKKMYDTIDRVYDSSVEKKVLNAQNYNIKSFFTGLEENFDEYLMNWKRHAYDYDTKKGCQPVEYFFNSLMFVVKYFDEAGFIQVSLEDNGVIEAKKFKLTKVDENIEEVYNWIYSTMEDYEA